MLTKEAIEQIINDSTESIKQGVIEQVKTDTAYQVRQIVTAEIKTIVSEMVKTTIAPAVQEALLKDKSALVAGAVAACNTISEQLAIAMVAAITENLSQSYSRKKIIDALFE